MKNDQIFTPSHIVRKMLDDIGYTGENLQNRTIFEPSFGDGAFLTEIVSRILAYAKANSLKGQDIISMLDNVYGIELDSDLYKKCLSRLNKLLEVYNLTYDWKKLACQDALDYAANQQFDYVVGNPPYIRIHYLDEATRRKIKNNYEFGTGTTDLYVIFLR